jgi:hypothetical protein
VGPCFHGRLQLRRTIGNEPREPCKGVGQRHAVLIDENPRLVQPALEFRLRFSRRTRVDNIEREAEREHRQQRASEEDPIRERRGNRHQGRERKPQLKGKRCAMRGACIIAVSYGSYRPEDIQFCVNRRL